MLKSIKELQNGDTYSYNNELYTVVESAISNSNGALTILLLDRGFIFIQTTLMYTVIQMQNMNVLRKI